MKQVCQLNAAGYFTGLVTADESPLEPGVFLIPGGCVDAPTPTISEGQRAKWNGSWVVEDIPEPEPVELTYAEKRAVEYPSIGDHLDALWKGGEAAAEMLARVQAVKSKHPKPE